MIRKINDKPSLTILDVTDTILINNNRNINFNILFLLQLTILLTIPLLSKS